uniref:transmembrane protease serine 9-like n=1 Tax=Scatophagus argus TaxID=75038 RepID=UPI001ED7CFFB|nr:transmembrane protease serine 9-like [Scatophagus argus]
MSVDQINCSSSLSSNSSVGTLTVYLGRLSQSGPNPDEVSRYARDIIVHPSYDPLSYNNDIGLLKMSAPVKFSDSIFPVCLASENSTFHTGTSSWVAGWGVTAGGDISDVLQEVNLPVVGDNECQCTYPELTENMMCAGLQDGGKDTCQGDSGSALVTTDSEGLVWFQSGVVSFGLACAQPMTPGVYARVSRYQRWISSITGSSKPGFVTFTSPGVDSDLGYTCQLPATSTSSPTPTKDGNSIFDGGENLVHFSRFTHFMSLCVLLLSLYVLVGDG